MKRIDITKTTAPNGAISYSYNADMSQVTNIQYARDMSYLIADTTQALPEATEQDIQGTLPVPEMITQRQTRLLLNQIGKLKDVPTILDALPEPDKSNAWIEWEYAQEISRHHPMILALAGGLGLTDNEIDELFIQASQI